MPALSWKSPMPATAEGQKRKRIFVQMPGGEVMPKLCVRQIMKRWGWEEKEWWQDWEGDAYVGEVDLYWSMDASLVCTFPFPNVKLTNHYDGAGYLCNKLTLGWNLDSCAECAAYFYPRQHNLYFSGSLRKFLDDYAETQGESACQDSSQPASKRQRISDGWDAERLPEQSLKGPANAWVVKGTDGGIMGNNGLAVSVLANLREIVMECENYHWEAVIQKYLERPLVIPETDDGLTLHKVDMRLWVMVLDMNPFTVFAHPWVYFRIATSPYDFKSNNTPDPYAHKTNWRDRENRATLEQVLSRSGWPNAQEMWDNRTWPMLMDASRAAVLASQDLAFGPSCHGSPRKPHPPTFELFGLDFAIDDAFRPWLLEVNRSPAMLDDCKIPEIVNEAWAATETMIAIGVGYYDGSLEIPSAEELEAFDGSAAFGAERLFPAELLNQGCSHSPKEWCYGKTVLEVPQCLVRGLSLGEETYGRWLLIYKSSVEDVRVADQRSQDAWNKWNFAASEVQRWRVLRDSELPKSCVPVHVRWCYCEPLNAKLQYFVGLLQRKMGSSIGLVQSECSACCFQDYCNVWVGGDKIYSCGYDFKGKSKCKGKGKAWNMWGFDGSEEKERPTPSEFKAIFNMIAERCGVTVTLTESELAKFHHFRAPQPALLWNCYGNYGSW